jgi:ribosomal protein L29
MKKETKTKKSETDLIKEFSDKRLQLRDIRFGATGSKNKNVKEQKNIKKDIARILTSLNSNTK